MTTDHEHLDQHFEQLARQHAPRVLGYLLRRCPAADAADVWQQVMTIAWQRPDKILAADDDQALAWLIGTARRCHANLQRSERRRHQATQRLIDALCTTSYSTPTPDDSPVHRALNTLSTTDQEILRLKYWDRLTTEQIAAVLRIRPATCRKRLQRAREELEHQMSQGARPTAALNDHSTVVATTET